MRELSLFSGAGGGLLGTMRLGWEPVGYVEWDDYCQRVLAARIRDGYLPAAPIFGDVREFLESGAAEQYRGVADVVTAGFPCEAHSHAARGRNTARDWWPETARVVDVVRPRWVLLENVQRRPIERACRVLAGLGYSSRAACIGASDVGAPHRRARWWAVAHADRYGESRRAEHGEVAEPCGVPAVAWWSEDISRALGVDDGDASRVERLAAIGRAQVPRVVELAWQILSQ